MEGREENIRTKIFFWEAEAKLQKAFLQKISLEKKVLALTLFLKFLLAFANSKPPVPRQKSNPPTALPLTMPCPPPLLNCPTWLLA